jgi:hypothetical protein
MYEDEIPVGRAENLTNKRFGRWTVLYRVKDEGNSSCWKCRCDCGTERVVRKQHLKNGRSQSCGCLHKEIVTNDHLLDITGQRFGSLVAIRPTNEKLGTSVIWECQCDCGNVCYVSVSHLKQGNNKSCGCLVAKDIAGQKFGKLTAIEVIDKRDKFGNRVWRCKCECGGEAFVSTGNLTSGLVQSCGCLISKGEERVRTLLNESNIYFTTQQTFESCRLDSGRLAKFDFYVNNHYIIEYDGQQHFHISGWNDEENFIKVQTHDAYKNQWCKDNNIPLIRIPYTKLDTLCIEDLLLETTQFRIV